MRFLGSICASAALAWVLLCSNPGLAATPHALKALILTSPGVYHDYEQQTRDLAYGIARYTNVRFDVSLAETGRWSNTDFAQGYDVLIFNICMADNTDARLIANLRRQIEILGVPAVLMHCTMHSFRETDLWWPLYGLQTREHEELRALPQAPQGSHPILGGIPSGWTVKNDELYLNLQFTALPLLSSTDLTGKPNVTAWLAGQGATPVFGTTLGHSEETLKDPVYHRLLANAVLFVTGHLAADGTPEPGYEPLAQDMDILDKFSAPPGVKFLGADGQHCAMRKLALAATPCYAGCILNPLLWNEASRACKQQCNRKLPSSDELIAACTPGR